MGKTCFVFPGQGAGRGKMRQRLLGYRCAREVFDVGRRVFGGELVDLVIKGSRRGISGTVDSQASMAVIDCAYFRVLTEEKGLDCDVVAGHSLGTYAALYAAGFLDLKKCFELVGERAKLMEKCVLDKYGEREVVDNYMVAIVGSRLDLVKEYVKRQYGRGIWIANFNSGSQVVLSGDPRVIDKAADYFSRLKEGFDIHPLKRIDGPFHSPYMNEASKGMKGVLENVRFEEQKRIYISDHTGKVVGDLMELKRVLAKQISGQVNWVKAIETARGLECYRFVESGPGPLSGFMRELVGVDVIRGEKLLEDYDIS